MTMVMTVQSIKYKGGIILYTGILLYCYTVLYCEGIRQLGVIPKGGSGYSGQVVCVGQNRRRTRSGQGHDRRKTGQDRSGHIRTDAGQVRTEARQAHEGPRIQPGQGSGQDPEPPLVIPLRLSD